MKYLIMVVALVIAPASVFANVVLPQDQIPTAVQVYEKNEAGIVDVRMTIELEKPYYGEKEFSFGGTGGFFDKEGHVVTAAHVVKMPNDRFGPNIRIISYRYTVTLVSKQRKYKAEFDGWLNNDVARLKVPDINPDDYKALKFGDSDKLRIGETIYVIGSPYGLSNTFTSGKVSGLNRLVGMNYLELFIQTDAPINPGNSGGPLFNSMGEMVGITTARVSDADGLGFAVPVKLFKLDRLKKGNVDPPRFGAEALLANFARMGTPDKPHMADLSKIYALTGISDPAATMLLAKLTYPRYDGTDRWAIVTSVDETKADGKYSPAKLAGIKKGDLITKFNGESIQSGMDLRIAILLAPTDKEFEIELIRVEAPGVSKVITVKVKLEGDPNERPTF